MSKLLIKRIVGLLASIAALVSVLFIKVSITLTDGNETSKPIYKSFFNFIKDYNDKYNFARFMMILGFILICICVVYFFGMFVLNLLNKKNLMEKMNVVIKIFDLIIIGSVFVLLIAGLDSEKVFEGVYINNISLFGIPWVISLVFSLCPLVSDILIKE